METYALWRCSTYTGKYIMMQISIGFSFFFFSAFFRSSIVWWKVNNVACVSTTMSQYICLHWNSYFCFISNQKQYFLFLIWCYLLNISYHTLVAPNIMLNFHWYCMLQLSHVFDACFTISMYTTVILGTPSIKWFQDNNSHEYDQQ